MRPKIISGDNPETVAALARQAGLPADIALVSGLEFAEMDDAQFADAAQTATIFGRITPQQKEKLVDTLRQQGNYVAMIGDGVNDVLSLKKSNLGIAMESGTQATRAVADIILMKDSFAALAPAVSEGQRIVNGMQDILRLFLTRILSMALLIVSALVIGEFPLGLRNGSIVTLFSVGIPAVLLAFWAQARPTHEGHCAAALIALRAYPRAVDQCAWCVVVLCGAVDFLRPLRKSSVPTSRAREHPAVGCCAPRRTDRTGFVPGARRIAARIFVEPPTPWWTGGDELSGDWKPTILAVVLMIGFFMIWPYRFCATFLPCRRSPLMGLVIGATLIWTFIVRFFWRHNITARFLGIKYAYADEWRFRFT